ncbi:MAG: hypothetical protein H6564_01410 [Lewinellaceae bacterium]|nr:hypothetical protein [Lewinellaceae bacterium]
MKTSFLGCLLLLLFTTPGALFSQLPLYDESQSIEIAINGVRTVLYPSFEKPRTEFWYEPGLLYIERRKEAGRSRLSFSMEIQPSGEDERKPGAVAVSMVVNPVYTKAFEDELKKALVEMGRTLIDPFKPLESYKLVSLRPAGIQVANIAFDELFGLADWPNAEAFKQKKITLDKPFPIQLQLNHYDATVLLESLMQKRAHRVGRVEYADGRYVPLFLSFGFDEASSPLEHQAELVEGGWQVVFSNPTEHPVILNSFRYYSRKKGAWASVTVKDTIPAAGRLPALLPKLPVELSEEPNEISDINWEALYDLKAALKLYVKSRMAAPLTRIDIATDNRPDDRYVAPEMLFDSVLVEFRLADQFGLEHFGRIKLRMKAHAGEAYAVDTLFMSGFGGAAGIQYRFVASSPWLSAPFISRWASYAGAFTGDVIFIDLRQSLNDTWRYSGAPPLDKASIVAEAYVLAMEEKLILAPNSLKVAATPGGNPKVELRMSEGQLRGYIEFFMPIYPETIEAALQNTGQQAYSIAQLSGAEITLLLDGHPIARKQLTPDGTGHLRLDFTLNSPMSEKTAEAIKARPAAFICALQAKWRSNQGELGATWICRPLR